jgi:hypothetical protein
MAIVINEFEIVPAPAPKTESAPPPPPPTALAPEDLERVEERQLQRLRRLWAN